MIPEEDPELAEAAHKAASAAPSAHCTADRHGSYQAHRRHGCRCPETCELVQIQRSRWEVRSRAQRSLRMVYERARFREEVVQELLKGNRDMPHRHSERDEALRRAIAEHGEDDVEALAQRLGFSVRDMGRKLARARKRKAE